MQSFKWAIVLKALGMFFIGGLLSLIIFLAALSPRSTPNYWLWFYVSLFNMLWIEAVFYIFKNALKMRVENLQRVQKDNTLSQLGSSWGIFSSYYSIVSIIAGFLLFTYFSAPLWLRVLKDIPISLAPTITFWGYISGALTYLVIVRPLASFVVPKLKKIINKRIPSYTIEENNIVINLNVMQLFNSNKQYIIRISFDELDEVRILTWAEADTLSKYQLAPDLPLAIAATKELYQYFSGKIERPDHFVQLSINGNSLLLRGPNMFYLITVANPDSTDLISKFTSYKARSN